MSSDFNIDEGAILIWDNKKGNDGHPDKRGAIKINGVQYEIALWNSKKKPGSLNGKAQLPREAQQPAVAAGGEDDI